MTSGGCPSSVTNKSSTGPGRVSPTLPSRSPSSRSSPAVFTSFGLGWNNGGPAAIAWGWPIISAFILVIGMCMAEMVSAYPTSGGIYWWASKLGGAEGRLLHRLAQPHRIAGDRGFGCVRVRDLLRLDARILRLGLQVGQSRPDLPLLPRHPGDRRVDQHLLESPPRRHQQRLSVVARVRGGGGGAHLDLRPRPSRQRVPPSSPTRSTTPGCLPERPTAQASSSTSCPSPPSSPSTPSPVTTLRPICRRRPRAPVTLRRRACGGRSSIPPSAGGSCCCRSSSPFRTRPR